MDGNCWMMPERATTMWVSILRHVMIEINSTWSSSGEAISIEARHDYQAMTWDDAEECLPYDTFAQIWWLCGLALSLGGQAW